MASVDERDVRLQLLATPAPHLTILGSGHARDYDSASTLFHRAELGRDANYVADNVRDKVAYDEGANDPQS